MDPDAALADLYEAMVALEEFVEGEYPRPDLERAIRQAIDSFGGLNAWLKRGGFLPREWAEATAQNS